MVRVFYVVYFEDPRLQKALDSVRLICNPREKCRAHITVRGPYKQMQGFSALAKKLVGARIEAKGLGRFFTRTQSTVLIKCTSLALRRAWRKPEFGYVPHVTLYDGGDKEFATALWNRLENLDLRFWFRPTPLVPLLSKKGEPTSDRLELRQVFDSDFVARITGTRVNAEELDALATAKRLDIATALMTALPEYGIARLRRRSVPDPVNETTPEKPSSIRTGADGQPAPRQPVPLLARHA